MRKIIDEVDVICRHNADGTIVPLRLRFMNEDGEYETYTIKGCREAEKKGTHTAEDGIYVSDSTFIFECLIISFGAKRIVRAYYDPRISVKWRLAI